MDDHLILARINGLADEEERLYERAGDGQGLSGAEAARLDSIKVQLDQCYDLLHQRQARRAAGLSADDAHLRSARTVEGYEQ